MSESSAGTARILLVEDEVLVRMFAVDALDDAGFKVDEASTAAEALLKARDGTTAYCAAIVDLGLPDRPGDELAVEILAERPNLPILIASGRSERELRDRFGSDKRIALLVKPYTSSMLLEALGTLGINAPGASS